MVASFAWVKTTPALVPVIMAVKATGLPIKYQVIIININLVVTNLIMVFCFINHQGGIGGPPNYPRNPLNELGNYPGVYPGAPNTPILGGSPTGYGAGSGWFGGQSAVRPGFTTINSTYSRDHGFICPAQLRVPKGLDYVVRVGGKVYPDCGAPCKGMFFSENEVQFSRLWVLGWSAVCMASCLFTVSLKLSSLHRFSKAKHYFIRF